MGVVGATVAGLAAANAIAGTIKNVVGAVKEVGEAMNNAYEGGKKVIKDLKNLGKEEPKQLDNDRKRRRGGSRYESKD